MCGCRFAYKGIKKSIVQRIEDRMEIELINKFDGLIPVTKHIQTDFAPNTPFIVVEAGFENVEEKSILKEMKIKTQK